MIPVDTTILALAGAGIPGGRALIRDGWADRLDDVSGHGLAGFLGWAAFEGLVDLDDRSSHRLELRLEAEAIRSVQLEGELIRLRQVLTDLPAVVLKGAVLAHEAYPDPSLRPFTDLDILVAGPDHLDAVHRLEALGYERTRPEPAPGYDARVGKALTLAHPGGVVVDLHRTLVAGNLGDSIDVEEIIAERRVVLLHGVEIPGPTWEAHLVEVALHAVMGDGLTRALSIRDIAQVALHPDLDADRAVELVRRWKATETVAHGLRAVVDGIGIALPGPLGALADQHPVLTPVRPAPSRSAKSRIDELVHGDISRRVTLTRALVAPSPAFMRWSYGTRATPKLYGRRWLELSRRALEARVKDPSDPSEQVTEPPSPPAEPVDHVAPEPPPPSDPATPRLAQLPAPPRPEPVAVAPRPPVALVTLRPPEGPRGTNGSGDSRLHPRARSRQQRWSATRSQRPNGAGGAPPTSGSAGRSGEPEPDPSSLPPSQPTATAPPDSTGMSHAIAGALLLVLAAILARLGIDFMGLVLVPAAGLLFAVAAGRRIARHHPGEEWIGGFLILGVAVKLGASYLRYLTLVTKYDSQGDAIEYDEYGRKFADAFMGSGVAPHLDDLRRTNFVRAATGWVYVIIGPNIVAGFFAFGLLALVGSYLWYRATVDAVPGMNKRLYLGLVFFAPSIAFWPSSIGKEALMQLGIGLAALGTSLLLRQRLLLGLAIGVPGGWLLWVVRPHLLALVTVAAGCAYLAGRVRGREKGVGSFAGRPVGVLVIAVLMAFAVSQATKSLGISELSLSSVETELDAVSEQTGQGGSKFDTGGNSLSPLNLPEGMVTVLLRPLPFEVRSPFELLASIESMILVALIVKRFSSIKTAIRRARASPFLLYCVVLLILYAATFSSFANFGILVRQRSLVMPALFVLLAINPIAKTPRGEKNPTALEPVGSEPAEPNRPSRDASMFHAARQEGTR